QREAVKRSDWNSFDSFRTTSVAEFYERRGHDRRSMRETIVYKIAQDLSGRLAVKGGMACLPDYRGELKELIRKQYPTQRAFCEATGLAGDMVSHVLARRKHLAI